MHSVDLSATGDLPESFGYRLKRRLLGEPLVTEQLSVERLSTPVAVGVLSCDMISSSAYGTEEILTVLVPAVGLAAFSLVLPLTFAILAVLVIVTLSYREVVMVYTRAGGSYVVARDNFGPHVAQFAAVALLIDYVLTVAVQTAAGTAGITSAFPALTPYTVPICIAVICILLWGNLRGIREAGRTFAFPTYFYVAMLGLVVMVGLVKAATTGLPVLDVHANGALALGHGGGGLLQGASLFIILRAFANGGSSLTGLEAISNSVSALKPPEGLRARRVQVITGTVLGSLVLGVSVLAHSTHAIPYEKGTPTVISQIAKVVFGHGALGQGAFYVVQLATVMILYTGGNTSFNGFPFLASFVAEDRFLPRALARRGHRLTFSNGIIVLGVVALALIVITRAKLDALVSLYAIGVFTGFTMAGSGMVKHHITHRDRDPGWRHKAWINGTAAVVSALVVLIFAVTKFTEGAWAVVVLFPVLMWVLIRTHRRYFREAAILGEGGAERAVTAKPLKRHVVFVLVDSLDLATARAVQYARTQSVDDVRAVHFVLDSIRAQDLENRWVRLGMKHLPLELVECPDRRLVRACVELAAEAARDGLAEVTMLLPRRAYGGFWARLLHDQTAERISAAVSRSDHVNATIVPFDVDRELQEHQPRERPVPASVMGNGQTRGVPAGHEHLHVTAPGAIPISAVSARQTARVACKVKSLTVKPWGDGPSLEVQLADDHGKLVVAFLGRRQIAGLSPGSQIVVEGMVSLVRGQLTMINPEYEFVTPNPQERRGKDAP
ncbi:MAG: amino acid permease [Acidimicrobiaceae bacterium]|nr:amino acid permease [Acidimicrobiaceae bacterium]